jgi:hypothetical protein
MTNEAGFAGQTLSTDAAASQLPVNLPDTADLRGSGGEGVENCARNGAGGGGKGKTRNGPRVLVACEFSGTVRDAFRARGFDAWSCDLLPCEGDPRWHFQADVFDTINRFDRGVHWQDWNLLIAHPPCTYLSRAGARWWKDADRQKLADEAAEFVFALRDLPIPHIAIENPIGQLNQRWRYPDQTIQPYEFGHPFSKATCLWLKNLPPLMPTDIVAEYKPLIRSNTGAGKRAGQKSHGGLSGGLVTAKTFPGIAAAMAAQWGNHILKQQDHAQEIAA